MNITHIKNFLKLSEYLNFSQTSDELYISQSTLSRQISSMEEELGVDLFYRGARDTQLTEAGEVVREELKEVYDSYLTALDKISDARHDYKTTLKVGVLTGCRVGDFFPAIASYFQKNLPMVKLQLSYHSFNDLVEGLYNQNLDCIITLYFDIEKRHNLSFYMVDQSKDYIALNRSHRLARKDRLALKDLDGMDFFLVSRKDSIRSPDLILEQFDQEGVSPGVRFVPSVLDVMLNVEAGLGAGMLDERNILRFHPGVKFMEIDEVSNPDTCLVWHKDNENTLIKEVLKQLDKQAGKNK